MHEEDFNPTDEPAEESTLASGVTDQVELGLATQELNNNPFVQIDKISSFKHWLRIVTAFTPAAKQRRIDYLHEHGLDDQTLDQFSITGHVMLESRIRAGRSVVRVVGIARPNEK